MLNTQRDRVYADRRRALAAQDLSSQLTEYAERTVDDILEVAAHSPSGLDVHLRVLMLQLSQAECVRRSCGRCSSGGTAHWAL